MNEHISGRLAQPHDHGCIFRNAENTRCRGKVVVFEMQAPPISLGSVALCRTHRGDLHALLGDVCDADHG